MNLHPWLGRISISQYVRDVSIWACRIALFRPIERPPLPTCENIPILRIIQQERVPSVVSAVLRSQFDGNSATYAKSKAAETAALLCVYGVAVILAAERILCLGGLSSARCIFHGPNTLHKYGCRSEDAHEERQHQTDDRCSSGSATQPPEETDEQRDGS